MGVMSLSGQKRVRSLKQTINLFMISIFLLKWPKESSLTETSYQLLATFWSWLKWPKESSLTETEDNCHSNVGQGSLSGQMRVRSLKPT